MTAATPWPWERLAESNAPSHDLLVDLLAPQPAETFLDIGTGSGGVALRAARAGARVTGVDVAPQAVGQARRAAADEGLDAEFVVGDAQALPFEDASFDVVASAFGVNFASSHERAARELARVCRPGGRLALTLMPPESRAAALFTVIRRYRPGGDHPAAWGTEERTRELLGESFELDVRLCESPPSPEPPPEQAWELAQASGPLSGLIASLDAAQVEELRHAYLAIGERFGGRPRTYLLVLGRRR